jgi:hypothetical protein
MKIYSYKNIILCSLFNQYFKLFIFIFIIWINYYQMHILYDVFTLYILILIILKMSRFLNIIYLYIIII